jgi:N,N'-diacetyllegionaminate synthase
MVPHSFDIGGHLIGEGQPVFIIAEAGVNHNGDLDLAHRLVDVAARSGADAVKFQTAVPERVVSRYADKANYQMETTDAAESQLEMVRKLHPFPPEAFQQLKEHAEESGVVFLSSPFDEPSIDLLDSLSVAAFKIPSGEITNLPYLKRMAATGRPLIMSTGMSSLGEVETALHEIEQAGNDDVVILHCLSNYPADPAEANLRAMETMATSFGRWVGYSDHTPGIEVTLAAVAMGARVIEKHFTLDRDLAGPDHAASLTERELTDMVRGIRIVESAIGDGLKVGAPSEANTADVARKSLVAAKDIAAGTVLTEDLIDIKRPGTGLPPAMRPHLVGRTVAVDVPEDTLLTLDALH